MTRYFLALILGAICFHAAAQAGVKLPAAEAYNERLKAIADKALHAALMKHQDRLNGVRMKIHYAVDRDGHVHNVKVTSQGHDTSAEKIVADTISAITFPPIPIDAQLEVGAGYLELDADVTLAADALTASKIQTPTAYEYNMRVHGILQNDVKPSFHGAGHLEVDYEFFLDSQGHVTSMNVHAKVGGQSAEQILARSIRRIKCPPIPPKVFKELEQTPPLKIFGTMTWDPSETGSNSQSDQSLSSDDIVKIKEVCHETIGLAFRDAALWRGLQPFARTDADFYQPTTTCGGQYCSGGLRLRDGSEVLCTYLHVDRNSADLTPDRGRKGNNRIVGISVVRHGKTIFSEGRIDRDTTDLYLRNRDSSKRK